MLNMVSRGLVLGQILSKAFIENLPRLFARLIDQAACYE